MAPRITPGTREEIGLVNDGITRALGAATGGPPPNLFATLARHRRLFRRWLRFAGGLMPGGMLPRADTELLILRVAHNTGCEYEWRHHERIGRLAGLGADEIEWVRAGPEAEGWTPRRALLLQAADELHRERRISDRVWEDLRPLLSDEELIELCLLVGHYEMLAMTIHALRIEPDAVSTGPAGRAARVMRSIADRRQGGHG
jgi:AhpD family alkylhydroperoxidase